MTAALNDRSTVLDENQINALHAAGDIDTLAQALRNIVTVTDAATRGAMAAAQAQQEYVPTVLHKDEIYRAMDAALTSDASEQLMDRVEATPAEEAEHEREHDEVADAYRAAVSVLHRYDDWDDMPAQLNSADRDVFLSAAFLFVFAVYDHRWFAEQCQDTTLRGAPEGTS